MYLRKANQLDVDHLCELVYNSEKSLGFDENYMAIFKDKYNINKDFLENSYSYCMVNSNQDIVGFFGLQKNKDYYELEFFYIDSKYIGKGYGKIMFNYLIDTCKTLEINEFYLVTSPESIGFYTRLGAIKICEEKSHIDSNRIIPKLKYVIELINL